MNPAVMRPEVAYGLRLAALACNQQRSLYGVVIGYINPKGNSDAVLDRTIRLRRPRLRSGVLRSPIDRSRGRRAVPMPVLQPMV